MDETRIIAWIDGELSPEEAAEVAAAVAADPDLATVAERHRRLRARFKSAFAPLLAQPVARPIRRTARIVSLAAVREERAAAPARPAPLRRNWPWPAAVATALLIGLLAGHGAGPGPIADRNDALALAAPIAQALDTQVSGELGTVNVAVSFKDHGGRYCRGFVAQYLGGVACKDASGWQLRYAAPVDAQKGDYRQAGGDAASARVIAAMIAGAPLDPAGERKAIAAKWR
ncbi:anti-sigma factor family protein [Sphingomonas oryzagri]